MRAVGLWTSHARAEIAAADRLAPDFTALNAADLLAWPAD